jgi:hypothetical protein
MHTSFFHKSVNKNVDHVILLFMSALGSKRSMTTGHAR